MSSRDGPICHPGQLRLKKKPEVHLADRLTVFYY